MSFDNSYLNGIIPGRNENTGSILANVNDIEDPYPTGANSYDLEDAELADDVVSVDSSKIKLFRYAKGDENPGQLVPGEDDITPEPVADDIHKCPGVCDCEDDDDRS